MTDRQVEWDIEGDNDWVLESDRNRGEVIKIENEFKKDRDDNGGK